jgi:hypothetical protein
MRPGLVATRRTSEPARRRAESQMIADDAEEGISHETKHSWIVGKYQHRDHVVGAVGPCACSPCRQLLN